MSARQQEGWSVAPRPPLIAMAVLIVLLIPLLLGGGWLYMRHLGPATHPVVRPLPAPRLELRRTFPGEAHHVHREPTLATIDRAMAETAAQGDALWGDARP